MNKLERDIDARIAPLLPAIYEAATNPATWPAAFAGVVRAMGGHRGVIFTHQATPDQNGLWVYHNLPEDWLQLYGERYHAYDIWMQRGYAQGGFIPGNVRTSDDLLPRQEFLESVFYREYLVLQDIYDLCAGILHDGSEPDVPIVHAAIYRPIAQPPFDMTDKALMAALIPHLREATRIGFRLAAQKRRLDVMEHAVEAIAPALLLLDARGQLVFANRPARGMLEASDGLGLDAGKLNLAPKYQAKLARLLEPTGGDPNMLQVARPSGRADYWLVRVPIPAHADQPTDARRPAFALLIHDSAAAGEIDIAAFAQAHGLTPAESRLLRMLAEHATLPPIAQALGVSINTVRTQLRSVLEKSGTHRQAELMRMLMAWPRKIDSI